MYIQHFFTSAVPLNTTQGSYDPAYVVMSYLIAALASYLALALARRLSNPKNLKIRNLLLSGGALCLGAGIWAMHFIGMMAFKMDMPMGYDPYLTISSLCVAIISGYGVLWLVGRERLLWWQILVGAVLLGCGISAMHYIGMAAMVMNGDISFQPRLFFLSVAIAIGASAAALWICFWHAHRQGKRRHYLKIGASLVMATAICGMHYTGMFAAVIVPHDDVMAVNSAFSTSGITICVAVIGVIMCLFLPVVIYKSLDDSDEASADRENIVAFPAKFLTLSVLCTFGLLIWIVIYSLQGATLSQNDHMTSEQLQDVASTLKHIAWISITFSALLIGTWILTLRSLRRWRNELRNSRVLLRTILDHMPLALFAKDAAHDYRYILLNRKAEEMFCLSAEKAVGKTDKDFFSSEEANFFRETDEKVMAEQQMVIVEEEPITTPKGTFMGHTIKVPIYDAAAQPHILLGMTEDVTDRARAREELRLAKEKAENSDKAKSEFLANMSHELRTPLNSILGTISLLQEMSAAGEQKQMIDTVAISSKSLLDIVNDILDLSKIEAGALQLEKIGFDLSYVLRNVIDRLEPLAHLKHLTIMPPVETSVPFVLGDPSRIERVFTNLISNAIKYTDQGYVRVHVSYRTNSHGHILYRCEVTDTGIGIPADKHDAIFEKFTQADSSITRRYGGTGLGLAITRQLVEMMGGQIGVVSKPGVGSTFWIEILYAVTNEVYREGKKHATLAKYNSIPASEARILIAEDHPMNQVLMERLMKRFGIPHFKIVADGLSAVSAFKNDKWDMILMDCHMPEKSGYDASLEIRTFEQQHGGHIPIIAMTANAMVGERDKCLASGMDEYISKPIIIDDMADLIGQWVELPEKATPSSKSQGMVDASVNLSAMRSFTDGDKNLEKQLIESFLQQSEKNMSIFKDNLISGESTPWIEAAHMLKGGAAGVGAERLSELCEKAQSMKAVSADERVQIFKQIENAYALVSQALQVEIM